MTTEATEKRLDAFGRDRFRIPLTGDDRGGSATLVPVDNGGRIITPELTERELMEEITATLRTIADAISALGMNPSALMSRMMPGMGSVAAAMQAVQQGR